MRVLWTHNFNPAISGKGSFLHSAVTGLRARGVDVQLEYLGNLRSPAQIIRARSQVKQLAPAFDLVHAQFGSACGLVTAAIEGVPKLLTIRGSDWSTYDATMGFLYFHTRVATAFTRMTLKSFDGIISVSRRMADQLAATRGGLPGLVFVLPSPVDLAVFTPRVKQEARALLGHANCTKKWVLFNSLDLSNPIKRFRLAQEAFNIAKARHGNLRLRLATRIPYDQMPIFVAACDAILCTSATEGWPNSVKEALACNVPFVATDVSDLRDIAAIDPTCRVCPADAEAIAVNLCQVLDLEGAHDLRRHVSGMSLDVIAEQTLIAYQTVLARYGGRRGIEHGPAPD